MRTKKSTSKKEAEATIRTIRRVTRKQYSAEEKIRIVLARLRGEESTAALCRREGIAEALYYKWLKDFLEAGKKRLASDTERAANTDEVKAVRHESRHLKEAVADLTLENRMLKKHDWRWGRRYMRYPASEKQEIIRLVEKSHLPVSQTLQKLGVSKPTSYRWYNRWLEHGTKGLKDKSSAPTHIWNRIPDDVRERVIEAALDDVHLSPRELALKFTDTQQYFVSEVLSD